MVSGFRLLIRSNGHIGVPIYVKIIVGIFIAGMLAVAWWWAMEMELLSDGAALRRWFEDLGIWGPVAVIGAMVVAILVSPIPSAPIGIAAGAIYGNVWGTVYVLAGSEMGAIAAFFIARFVGYDILHRWFGEQLKSGLAGSQNFLMLTLFVSRLMPFLSFDIVSYAAGLTNLSFWRFAAATLAGIIPAAFLLAHFGSVLVDDEMSRIVCAVLLLGLVTALPFVVKLISKYRQN